MTDLQSFLTEFHDILAKYKVDISTKERDGTSEVVGLEIEASKQFDKDGHVTREAESVTLPFFVGCLDESNIAEYLRSPQ